MKKIIPIIAALLLGATCSIPAFAADTTVYVTIADANGDLVLSQEAVAVTDADADGVLTINDALYSAHEANYEGGAAVGYGFGETEYGVSMNKLWGAENGGSYGYYLNNTAAWSLVDPIADGDYINAFVYTDLTAWSDTFCFFDVQSVNDVSGNDVTVTLSASAYDENYNPITVPVADAVITVNGEATEYMTDSEGKVTLTLGEAGEYIISATSDNRILVPPVCKATVSAPAPQTADTAVTLMVGIGIAIAAATVLRRRIDEK